MLRSQGPQQFSWAKTTMIILSIVAIVIVFFVLSFNLGKKIIARRDQIKRVEHTNFIFFL